MDEPTLAGLLADVASGRTSVDEAVYRLRVFPLEEIADATLDHHRELRTGQAEAVYAPGKTPSQVRDAAVSLVASATGAVFVTRATPDQFHALLEALPEAIYTPRSRLIVAKRATVDSSLGTLAVVSAGTSDLPVADEAARTAEALGIDVTQITDVGVAGIHRILAKRDEIDDADVVIVVAGMEGALASVVTGLVSHPVIAVPTSVGYGASFEGLAALLAMLNSCAPGATVVNIDNGFGAALAAHRILTTTARPRKATRPRSSALEDGAAIGAAAARSREPAGPWRSGARNGMASGATAPPPPPQPPRRGTTA